MRRAGLARAGDDAFCVSVKGVLEVDGKFLLRRNQREEYELPGGKLEREDASAKARLIAEFREESGIRIEVLAQREPWLYEVGEKSILIVPFLCRALEIPAALADADGGTLHWLRAEEIARAPMPRGYRDTIRGEVPRRCGSPSAGAYFRILPNYVDWRFRAEVCVRDGGGSALLRAALPRDCSPRELIAAELGERYLRAGLAVEPMELDRARDAVVLNYRVDGPAAGGGARPRCAEGGERDERSLAARDLH